MSEAGPRPGHDLTACPKPAQLQKPGVGPRPQVFPPEVIDWAGCINGGYRRGVELCSSEIHWGSS